MVLKIKLLSRSRHEPVTHRTTQPQVNALTNLARSSLENECKETTKDETKCLICKILNDMYTIQFVTKKDL